MNALRIFIAATLLITTSTSFSQNQNSQEHHRQFNPQHPGYDGNRNSSQSQRLPSEVWQNHYGAIAVDPQAGKAGVSENETSTRRARQAALQQCGTRNCVIRVATTNGCLAMAYGGGKTSYSAENTAEAARQTVMNRCQAGATQCELAYLHCNHPVRIR